MRVRSTVLLLAVVAVTACGPTEPSPEETTLTAIGQLAPDFTATTLSGETFQLGALHGKVVLVNFFATWCPPCREEMPHLEREVWQRFGGSDFTMIALGREHSDDELRQFVSETSFTFPIAADPDRAAYSLYATQFIPRTIVIGADGAILFQSSGFERDEFDRMIDLIEGAIGSLGAATGGDHPEQPPQLAGQDGNGG